MTLSSFAASRIPLLGNHECSEGTLSLIKACQRMLNFSPLENHDVGACFEPFEREPPPCVRHSWSLPIATRLQPSSLHRTPPPCCNPSQASRPTCQTRTPMNIQLTNRSLTAAQNCVRPRATFSHSGWAHFFPPPCFTQNFVDDCADLSQPSTAHRRPPPWLVQRFEPPTADLEHPSWEQRLPPPCLGNEIGKRQQ